MAKSYQQLEKEVQVHRQQRLAVEHRYLPCPDHRDKHKAGDECLVCQLERALAENARLRKVIDRVIALIDIGGSIEFIRAEITANLPASTQRTTVTDEQDARYARAADK